MSATATSTTNKSSKKSSKKSRKKSTTKYYHFFVSEIEYEWLKTKDIEPSFFKQILMVLANTTRPTNSQYNVFIQQETNPYDKDDPILFICYSTMDQNVIAVLGGNAGWNTEFTTALMKHHHNISTETAKKFLEEHTSLKKSIEKSRNNIFEKLSKFQNTPIQQKQRVQMEKQDTRFKQNQLKKQILLAYGKQIDMYVSDLQKPIQKKHYQAMPIIQQRRTKLISQYIKNPTLSFNKLSNKNKPIIKKKIQQEQQKLKNMYSLNINKPPKNIHPYYLQKINEARQQHQRQLMRRQDISPEFKQHRSKINQLIQIYGDDINTLAEEIFWKEVGLIDPISFQIIQTPVLLPSTTIIDQKSVSQVRKFKRDPMTNLQLPENIVFKIDNDILKLIREMKHEIRYIKKDKNIPLDLKVYQFIKLREKWKKLIERERKKIH